MKVLWFLPTHGESRYLGTGEGGRAVDLPYLTPDRAGGRCARLLRRAAADRPQLRGQLGRRLGAGAADQALRFLVAVRPGLLSPTMAARMTATLDRIRTGVCLSTLSPAAIRWRMAATASSRAMPSATRSPSEFLQIYKRVLAGETVDFTGTHFRIEDGRLLFPPVQTPHPPLYFGGSSEAANGWPHGRSTSI